MSDGWSYMGHYPDKEQMSRETDEARWARTMLKDVQLCKTVRNASTAMATPDWHQRRAPMLIKCASGYAWNKHTARVPPLLPPHPISIGPKVAVAYEEGKKT